MERNLYDRAMSQKWQENSFNCVEGISEFKKEFIKIYNENTKDGYFSKLMFNDLKFCIMPKTIYHFYLKKNEDCTSWNIFANLHDQAECVMCLRNLKLALSQALVLKKFIDSLSFIKRCC